MHNRCLVNIIFFNIECSVTIFLRLHLRRLLIMCVRNLKSNMNANQCSMPMYMQFYLTVTGILQLVAIIVLTN